MPLAVEREGDSAWELFERLSKQQDDILKESGPGPLAATPPVDVGYALTAPMGLPTTRDDVPPARVPRAAPRVTLDAAMVEARRNNRVCPRPEHWIAIYEMLPGRTLVNGKQFPTPPITGPAWKATPSLPKRLFFREHLEWAERHKVIDAVYAQMKQLPEDAWLHMGDD